MLIMALIVLMVMLMIIPQHSGMAYLLENVESEQRLLPDSVTQISLDYVVFHCLHLRLGINRIFLISGVGSMQEAMMECYSYRPSLYTRPGRRAEEPRTYRNKSPTSLSLRRIHSQLDLLPLP